MAIYDNISALLADVFSDSVTTDSKVRIAAATFSIFAFDALSSELQKSKSFEFIFTAPSFAESEKLVDSISSCQREIARLGEQYLSGSPLETPLLNKLNHHRIAQECYTWIENQEVTFKANVSDAPLQSFAVISSAAEEGKQVGLSPLSGFTASTLGRAESPKIPQLVASLEPSETKRFLELFNIVWNDAAFLVDVTTAIKEALVSLFERNSPAFVYYVILFNIFSEFLDDLEEDFLPNDLTGFKKTKVWQTLFNFQKDAAVGVINKLEKYNGCILADSVGLGKTYTALAVIKYFELRNKNVLVLAPKKLMANWTTYNQPLKTNTLIEDRFSYKVLAHTDLSRERGMSGDIDLSLLSWGNFDLVVIDESHNFRNTGTSQLKESRYDKLMRKVIREGVDTKVLMLSATPVNNRFTDLRNQLTLAIEGRETEFQHEAHLKNNVDTIFRLAQKEFNGWSKLAVEERTPQRILKMLSFDFFELLDAVTIARSRKQIQRNYDTQAIGTFPTRLKPISLHPPLTTLETVPKFETLNNELLKLNLAVYAPLESVHASLRFKYEDLGSGLSGGQQNISAAGQTAGLKKLMAVNLLKRLESSVEAFRLTLLALEKKLKDSIATINAYEDYLENNLIGAGTPQIRDESAVFDFVDDDGGEFGDSSDYSVGSDKKPINLADMDYLGWRDKLIADLEIISDLLEKIEPVEEAHDAKLQQLFLEVERKIQNPINEDNKKILIFTAFADTANYLYTSLKDKFRALGLHSAVVTGSDRPQNSLGRSLDFQQTLTLFSPQSKSRDLVMPGETQEIDVLIGTDCISEGQNLQDCDYLINYDIHWNPVRIIQRFGRVDRIGSQNKQIQLVNFWPSMDLDEYINLKERVEGRMIIADIAGTADDNILMSDSDRAEADYRKQQLQRLQEEVLDLEDANTGVSITDLGLNDFRLDLLAYLREFGSLSNSPKGIYAVAPSAPRQGVAPGAFFAVRDTSSSTAHRGNRLHPYYLLYVDDSGEQVVEHNDVKAVLDKLRISAASYNEPIEMLCDEFDRRTKNGSDLSHYENLLQSALKTIDSVGEQREVEDLFDGTLGAKAESIVSSKRHELIAFIAVLNVESIETSV